MIAQLAGLERPLKLQKLVSTDKVALEALRNSHTGDAYYEGCARVSGGLDMSKQHSERERLTPDASGIVVALVGLPARGKSFISRKLERFLKWKGLPTRMFNVGKYRRQVVAPEESGRSDFFDPNNNSAVAAREAAAVAALEDALNFLSLGGKIAILDATNSTIARRRRIVEQVRDYGRPFAVVFVEAICNDQEVLEANMMGKVQNSPDFRSMSTDEALADLQARIAKYEAVYETVQDDEGAYIKLYDLSSKIMVNHCYGRIAKSILPYMMAIHIGGRPIWLARAGSGLANPQSPHAGDRLSKLSMAGRCSAQALSEFVHSRAQRYWAASGKRQEPTQVVTSTMPRAVAFVSYVTIHHEQTSVLNPIDKGAIGQGWWDVECQGDMPPWEDMQQRHPEFYAEWVKDPAGRRFPGGESYMDVVRRLESVLVEVEMSTRPVLIVSHITVLQLLLAYFRGIPVEEAWNVAVPKNTVFEVSPTTGGGFMCEAHPLPAPTVGTDEEAAPAPEPEPAPTPPAAPEPPLTPGGRKRPAELLEAQSSPAGSQLASPVGDDCGGGTPAAAQNGVPAAAPGAAAGAAATAAAADAAPAAPVELADGGEGEGKPAPLEEGA